MSDVGISVALRGMDSVARGFGKIGTDAKDLGTRAQTASRGVDSLSSSMRRLQTAIVGLGLLHVAKGVVDTALAFQKLDRTLTVATGSTKNAADAMKFVRTQADRLGLDLKASAEGFARVSIAAKGTALEGDSARKIFVGVSEAAAVMGLTADETTGALRAIEQMISKGNVSAEELRGQLGERLPGAFQIAARSMGLTVQQMNKLLDQGLLRAEDLLPRFAAELHKTFGSGVTSAAGSAQAAVNRFSTSWTDLQLAFARSGFLDGIVEAMQDLSKTMKDPEFMAAAKSLGQFMGWAAKQTGWLIQKIGESIEGYRMLYGWIKDVTGMQGLIDNANYRAPQAVGRDREMVHSQAKHGVRGRVDTSGVVDVWGGPAPGAFTNPLGGKKSAAEAKAAREEAKRYREELQEIEQQGEELRHTQEQMWGEANALIEGTLTPLEKYTMDLDRLNDLYKGGFITSAEDYNRVLGKMNQELARSSETFRSFENAADSIFDAAIAGGEDFEETLQDIAKQLASDIFKSNIYNPFKDAVAGAAGSIIGGGDEQAGGNGMATIFNDFLKGLGDLFTGDEGFLASLGKLFMGDDGLIPALGKMFGGAWEWLGGLFTSFLTELGIMQAWHVIELWAIAIWDIAQRWAVAIFEAAAGFFGLETGGDVTVTRPTLIMVGEKHKAERLRVSPLSGRSQEAGRAGARMAEDGGNRKQEQTIVQVMLPQSSIITGLTESHFARNITKAVRRQNSRYV